MLEHLPIEMLFQIALNLNIVELHNLSQALPIVEEVINADYFWRLKLKHDFNFDAISNVPAKIQYQYLEYFEPDEDEIEYVHLNEFPKINYSYIKLIPFGEYINIIFHIYLPSPNDYENQITAKLLEYEFTIMDVTRRHSERFGDYTVIATDEECRKVGDMIDLVEALRLIIKV